MRWEGHGRYGPRTVPIVWEDGKLVEPTPVELIVEVEVIVKHGGLVIAPHYDSGPATLDDPWMAKATVEDALRGDVDLTVMEGVPPTEIPEGAVGEQR